MILALVGAAWAGSCCSTAGITPSTLATCDRLGLSVGLSGGAETGGWAWGGDWSAVGDDGGQRLGLSAAALGRASPWLQGGVALQPGWTVDALDGVARRALGLERAVAWADLETPAGFGGERAPRLALELGLGLADPAFEEPAFALVLSGLRAGWEAGPWGIWGAAMARAPLAAGRALEVDGAAVLDRALGAPTRLGLGVALNGSLGAWPSLESSLGPTFQWAPDRVNRLVVGLRAGLPVSGLGWNATAHGTASLEWMRVLRPW